MTNLSSTSEVRLDERRRRDELQRFETRLSDNAKENERLQAQYRTLAEENQRKRRNLQDLENEARNKARQNAEQNARLRQSTEMTRTEYQTLRDQLDQLVYQLKFSVEEELKIYETLLNSLRRQQDTRPAVGYAKTSLMDESKDYRPLLAPLIEKASTTSDADRTTSDADRFGVQQNLFDRSERRTKTTTTTTSDADLNGGQRNVVDRSQRRATGASDADLYGVQQNLLDRNQSRTTKTTRTTRRFGQEGNDQQKISMNINRSEQQLPELDENYMQSKIHITRKYKGQ